MLKRITLSALLISSLFVQNVFAKGAVSLNNARVGSIAQCSIGDEFHYDDNGKNDDKSLQLALRVDLSQVGTKRFNIVLDGAEWSSSMTEGSFEYTFETSMPYDGDEGITYRRQTDNALAVKIDGKKVNGIVTIRVPLNCVITGSGDIRAYLDGVVYSKESDNILFATSAKESEEVPNIELEGTNQGSSALVEAEESTEAATADTKEKTETAKQTDKTSDGDYAREENDEPMQRDPKSVSFVANGDMYYINDWEFETDTPAFISEDGYTMLPLRLFSETLDVKDISFDAETKTAVLILYDGKKLSITANEGSYTVDGVTVEIDGCAQIVDGRMYLPLRAMANAFGISNDYIDYDAETKTITVHDVTG